jgi:lathosterol oxidase
MDLVLQICDEYLLDSVYANLVPLKAFSASLASNNGTYWDEIVSKLPHPPLEQILQSTNAFAAPAISAWPRNYIPRQILSLLVLTTIGIHALYFIFAWFSYTFIFNHEMKKHPRFLKDQVKQEIQTSLGSFPGMILLTLPWFQAEAMGYSKLYDGPSTYGWWYLVASVPL